MDLFKQKRSSITWLVFGVAILLIVGCQPVAIETGSATSGNATPASDESANVVIIATTEAAEEEAAEEEAAEEEAAEEEAVVEAASEGSSISLSGVEQVLAVRAAEELAVELGVEASDIAITSMKPVEWPDASLGCPEEGMMYASVLTSGYRIMLDANGQQYEYHSSDRENSQVVRCEPKPGS